MLVSSTLDEEQETEYTVITCVSHDGAIRHLLERRARDTQTIFNVLEGRLKDEMSLLWCRKSQWRTLL